VSYILTTAVAAAIAFWAGRKHAKSPEWFAAKFQSIVERVRKITSGGGKPPASSS
jgi:F0F1-type ATP synthase membrane subunit a